MVAKNNKSIREQDGAETTATPSSDRVAAAFAKIPAAAFGSA